ncbi:MAG: DUF5698 domain-containing protein [Rhodothermales bacterium]
MPLDSVFAAPIGALLIALLRVADVSMAMMRMILAVRGHRLVASLLGFVEVLIWLVAVGMAIEHLNSILHVLGYAGGFAVGTYVGIWLEEYVALGTSVVHAVVRRSAPDSNQEQGSVAAARQLRDGGFAVTELEGRGRESSVDILNVVVPRRRVSQVIDIIRRSDPSAFVSIEEVRSVQGGHSLPAVRKLPFLSSLSLRRSQWNRLSGLGQPEPESSFRLRRTESQKDVEDDANP